METIPTFALKGIVENKVREQKMGFEYESPLVPSELFSKSLTSRKLVLLSWWKELDLSVSVCTENYTTFYKIYRNLKRWISIICQMPTVFIKFSFLG